MKSFIQYIKETKTIYTNDEFEDVMHIRPFKKKHADDIDSMWEKLKKHSSSDSDLGIRFDPTPPGEEEISHKSNIWKRGGTPNKLNTGFVQTKEKHSGTYYIPLSIAAKSDKEQFTKELAMGHKFYGRGSIENILKNGPPNNIHLISTKRDPASTAHIEKNRDPGESEKYPEAISSGRMKILHTILGKK